ncbi:MAG: tetratricopeptide repeat protein [Bacteroidales bacterium]|nr:MAG: tetratricopeptide repeat protein [Bacteroidales bacterium]
MQKIFLLIILVFLCFLQSYSGSTEYPDSVKENIEDGDLTDRLFALIELAEYNKDDSAELVFLYSSQARELALKLGIDSILGKSYMMMGISKLELGDFYESENYLTSAQNIYTDLQHTGKLAIIYFNLGIAEYFLGNYKESIRNYQNALTYYTDKTDKQMVANIYQNIGVVHRKMENYKKALEYYNKSLTLNTELENEYNIAGLTQNIGLVYINQELYDTALYYVDSSYDMYVKMDNKEGIGRSFSNMGAIYQNKNNSDKALYYYLKAHEIFNRINYQIGKIYALHNLGTVCLDTREYKKALSYFQKSLDLSRKYGHIESTIFNYKSISDLYKASGNYEKSLKYYVRYDEIKDSVETFETRKKVAELEGLYNYEQKGKELTEKNAELKQQKILKNVFILGSIFLLFAFFIIYNAYRKKKKAEQELKEHHDNLEKLVRQRTKELDIEISERKIAEESDKLKTAFLSNMSHELRTPMNAIIAFSYFLKDPGLSEEKRNEYLNYISNAGDNLLQLIDDIIDCAKIEAGQLNINKTECNITGILTELLQIFNELKIKKNKGSIEFRINPECLKKNVFIETDPLRLKQVLNNLLENSLKYTLKGYVEMGFKDINHNIQFYVKDTGIGIQKDKHSIIFERFLQVNALKDQGFGGPGLGLSICKNLVNLLGGDISVESELNKGSVFSFTIPYKDIRVEDRPARIESESPAIKMGLDYKWDNKTILVVEDEDLNYKVLESALSRTNAKILRANDGLEAIQLVKDQDFNLVLMDIQIPKVDGYNATKEIKKIKSNIPVIAQTSFAMSGERERCIEAGCDDYLAKPLNLAALLSMIDKYIN